MIDDPRYPRGVALFQALEFFEAHEELELAWRACPPGDDRRFLQGLIQLAVSLEHWRRGNPGGAQGQWGKALWKLEPLPPVYAGLRLGELLEDFEAFYGARGLSAAVEARRAGPWTPPTEAGPWPVPRWEGSTPGSSTPPPGAGDDEPGGPG